MKFDNVISSGCSIAWGDELEDRNDRYAAIVARHFNSKLFDLSMQGASNELIANSITNDVPMLLSKKQIEIDNTLVVVGWTFKERLHYYSKSGKYYSLRPSNMSAGGINFRKILEGKDAGHIDDGFVDHLDLKMFYDNHATPAYLVYNFINNLHRTEMYLKHKGFKYIFFFVSTGDLEVLNVDDKEFDLLGIRRSDRVGYDGRRDRIPDVRHLVSEIDRSKVFATSMNSFCYKNKLEVGIGNHPLKDAHRLYSQELIKFVENIYD